MPGPTDREQLVEQLLRRGLRGAATRPPAACLDAETLAAWADRTLSPSQAAQVEHHLSDCARCQAMVAVFARTESAKVAAAPQPSSWLRWIVPIGIGAAAAGLILVVAWPGRAPAPAALTTRVEPPTSREAAPEAPSALGGAASVPPAPAANRPAIGLPPSAPPPPRQSANVDALSSAKAPEKMVLSSPYEAAVRHDVSQPVPMASPAPPPQEVAAETPPPSAQPMAQTAAPAALPPAAGMERSAAATGGALGAGGGRRGFVTAGGRPEPGGVRRALPPVVSEFEGRDQKATGGQTPPAGAAAGAAPAGRAGRGPAAPSVPVRWRILPSGGVERAPGGSAVWERIAIDPPAFIYAGDAPTSRVCWLVGRDGVVLRTTDAQRFDRLNVPDSANLVSVRALDAERATVTTIDGRTFSTIDGGLSWQSPLQESPASPF